MPHVGFAGVGHRMGHMKACDSSFLFCVSSRAAGRYTGSGGMKSGLVCMFYAGFAGVEHRKRMALHWVRYWLVLAALHTLLCPTSALPTSGHWRRAAHHKTSSVLRKSPTPAQRALDVEKRRARSLKKTRSRQSHPLPNLFNKPSSKSGKSP